MKSNASLRKIVENIPDVIGIPILVADEEGSIVYANSAAEEAFQASSKNIARKNVHELFRGIENFSKYFVESFSGKKIMMFDISTSIGGSEKISLEFMELASFAGNGETDLFSLISFRQKDESFVERFIGKGERDIEGFDIVWRGISHEVKNPLGGIRGAAQMLLGNLEQNSPFRNHARVIIREADRIARFLDELSQQGNGGGKRNVDVLTILTEAMELVSPQISETGKTISLKIIADTSLPALHCDPDSLFRAFTNLLKNAVEAIDERGTIRVTLKLHEDLVYETKGTGRHYIIEVEFFDTGKSIEEEEIPFLFLPFYTNKPGGAGLGLFFVRNTVKAQGGSIRLKVYPDGKAFKVYLPLKKEDI